MDERDEQEEPQRRPRPANEGVRIIGAEEAAAALEKGEAAGRRPEDAPRFGDVPPQPAGPRPAHRFPLPDSVDPASAVPRPPVAGRGPEREEPPSLFAPSPASLTPSPTPPPGRPAYGDYSHITDPDVTAETNTDEVFAPPPPIAPEEPATRPATSATATNAASEPSAASPSPSSSPSASAPADGPEPAAPGAGDRITFETDATELPHWTDPPTGEIPRALATDATEADDEAWANRGPRWRDSGDDWDEDFDVGSLADDEARVGALDTTRSDHSDLYDFDEPVPSGPNAAVSAEAEPVAAPPDSPAPTRIRTRTPEEPPSATPGEPDTITRVLTGALIFAVALACFAIGTAATAVLATIVVGVCAFELYDVLRRAGYLPATLLGLVSTVSVMAGAYWKGEQAIPLVLSLTIITTLLWYLFGVVRARPTVNVAATVMVFVWVGVLGSYATLMLGTAPHGDGVGLVIGAVLGTVACDVGSFFAGHYFGSRPLMPEVSPKKTWEGALGGLTLAILVSVFITAHIAPWDDIKHAAFLGLVIGCISPLGDLSESLIKRDIGVKDMGSLLPGHGGVFDRFDGMLFVLPATFYLAQYLKLH